MRRHLGDLLDAAGGTSRAPALLFEGRTIDRGELGAMARSAAKELRSLGVGEGSAVAVCLPNTPQLVAALLGTWQLGAVVVDMNPGIPPAQQAALAALTGARAMVTDSGIVARDPGEAAAEATADPRLACVNLTSGSTGAPKGVLLSHENLLRNAELYAGHFALTAEDRTCLVLPLSFGMNKIALLANLLVGARAILERGFAIPNAALAAMESGRATALVAVPAVVRSLIERGDAVRYPVATLRAVRVGAGRMDASSMEALRARFPDAEVHLTYGLTEVGLVATMTAAEHRRRPEAVGRVIPEVEVEIAPAGEIVVRCPHLALGYWGAPPEEAAAFREDGLHTDDLGSLDADGYLSLVGRTSELIKSGGENVAPAEVEAALLLHAAVAECAVVGVPDPWLGEAVRAFVVPAAGPRPDVGDLRRHCHRHLRPAARPRDIVLRASLPRSETGKVVRSALVG